MPQLKSIRFQKFDTYENPVFIANSIKEPVMFAKLTKFHKQLQKKNYDTFLPIYSDDEKGYASIRFKKNHTYPNLTPNAVYDLKYAIKQKEHEDKTYVSCYINSLKLVSKAPKLDLGEDLQFDDDDSDSGLE